MIEIHQKMSQAPWKANNQSEISIEVLWSVLTNQRPVLRSHDLYLYWPTRAKFWGHVMFTKCLYLYIVNISTAKCNPNIYFLKL